MPKFGKRSKARLNTCHKDIQKVMELAIQRFDFTVVFGHRTKSEQMELYKQGRIKENGQWKVVGKTVTNIDGLSKMSMHNYNPSKAIDIAPWVDGDIPWNDIEKFKEMAEVIKQCAQELGVPLQWGGDWKMRDYPHFELKSKY